MPDVDFVEGEATKSVKDKGSNSKASYTDASKEKSKIGQEG